MINLNSLHSMYVFLQSEEQLDIPGNLFVPSSIRTVNDSQCIVQHSNNYVVLIF